MNLLQVLQRGITVEEVAGIISGGTSLGKIPETVIMKLTFR